MSSPALAIVLPSRRSRVPFEMKSWPDGARRAANGFASPETRKLTSPVAGRTRSIRPAPFSTTRSDPSG
jgi:hypothetical protein